jgi:uncharacterized protein (TIRG00374 family)
VARRPRSVAWLLVRRIVEIGTIALAVYLVVPQLAGLEETGQALARSRWYVIVAVIGLEAASLLAYSEVGILMVRRTGERPPKRLMQRMTVVGLSLGRTLPGGSAAAMALNIRLLSGRGVDPARATAALAASGAVSSVALALLLPVASLLALVGGQAGGVAQGLLGVAAVVVIAAAALPLTARQPRRIAALAALTERVARAIARGPLRRTVHPEAAGMAVSRGLYAVRDLTRDPRVLMRAFAWAFANWLLDVAVLAVVAVTVGRGTPLPGLLLAYIVAQVSMVIPITPGGVGVAEAAMIASLVAEGAPPAAATATVFGYRIISHWLPVVAGLILLPTVTGLRSPPPEPPPRRRLQ